MTRTIQNEALENAEEIMSWKPKKHFPWTGVALIIGVLLMLIFTMYGDGQAVSSNIIH